MFLRLALAFAIVMALTPMLAVRAADLPKIAVYSFTPNGAVAPAVASDFADAIAAEIKAGGGVEVVRGDASVAASGARADARAHGADYFLIGALAPLGTSYSVISQLVRTRTGLLMWSAPAQAATAADLRGQGEQVRQVVLDDVRHSGFPTLAGSPAGAPPATPPPTPAPVATNAADQLRVPLSAPTVAPASAYSVLLLSGTAQPGDRAYAARAAAENIRKRGSTASAMKADAPALAIGADACASTGSATVVGGTLDITRVSSVTALPSTTASVTLAVYDCRTHVAFAKPLTASATAPIGTDAIRSAVDEALAGYFGSPLPASRL